MVKGLSDSVRKANVKTYNNVTCRSKKAYVANVFKVAVSQPTTFRLLSAYVKSGSTLPIARPGRKRKLATRKFLSRLHQMNNNRRGVSDAMTARRVD